MIKAAKLLLGLVLLSGVGLIYGAFNNYIDDEKEIKLYSHISFQLPDTDTVMTLIKRTPKSRCEKWRSEYFQASKESCVGCTVLHNECKEVLPKKYLPAFEQKQINSPYILKLYKYPEITVFDQLPVNAFEKICNMHKQGFESTKCILQKT